MTAKAQSLLNELGNNMAESLGQRQAAATPPAASKLSATGAKKYDGRTRSRDAGDMLLTNIIPDPSQPRKEFDPDSIERLAQSLKDRGQLQPIRVRWSEAHEKWVIVAGERRYRAALAANLTTISCVFVEQPLSENDILAEQLIENCLREDLKGIEQATAFQALMTHNGWSGKELAEHLHLNPSSVTRALALLTLPNDVQQQVSSGALAPSIAYEVAKLDDPAEQREVVQKVVAGNLSRDDAVAAVNAKRGKATYKPQRRSSTLTYKTPRKWTVVLTAPKQNVTDVEIVEALNYVLDSIRAKKPATTEAA
jgi:ParB family transcriptional regulator, chromosome partitioning protein